MTNKEAIANANALRPNAISDDHKARWLCRLEGEVAELMGLTQPANLWPDEGELLMPYPYDNIYELYLAAMIDNANEEADLYANDMAMANSAMEQAAAHYRRQNRPANSGSWRVM